VYEIAAAYAFHLAESQAYFDGNKRAGVEAALVFLEGSGIDASRLPEDETYDLMMKIAAHEASRKVPIIFGPNRALQNRDRQGAAVQDFGSRLLTQIYS
jgi:death-on-curing protein